MPIQSGTHLGPYEILSAIGAGGMGEVYRARDPNLGRDVAIKVLPEAFAGDPARMARFQREAKVLASLDHPNIASIYGLEDSGGTRAFVMQLVEGPTLADRIKQGPIPVDEAVRIARQIADALEYAHERGIIHRDLKPANIKVSPDDTVKVLDFGLAKALEGDIASLDISTSPTISRMATQAGVLLGTAAYMSPEQAKGKSVDRRADIWAFGCVFYEMLTGKMAFSGDTVTDTLAAVIKEEPDWSHLPAATPIRLRVLLQRCSQKDPKQRLQAIGDARISLDEVLAGAPEPSVAGAARISPPLWRRSVPWAAGFLAAAVAGVAVWIFKPSPIVPAHSVQRFEIVAPDPSVTGEGALSPDGTRLVFFQKVEGNTPGRLWLRRMDSLDAHPIEGTEGATSGVPFWSPDSRFIAFNADGKLKKIDTEGGPAQVLCDSGPVVAGGFWAPDGRIIFGDPIREPGLWEVPAGGGVFSALSGFEHAGNPTLFFPSLLPDGKHFLYTSGSPFSSGGDVYIGSLDSKPGQQSFRKLLPGAWHAYYVPSQDDPDLGYVLFGFRSGAVGSTGPLMAQAFDVRKLDLVGEPVPIADQVPPRDFSASLTGTLVYVSGRASAETSQLTIFDRQGKVLGIVGEPGSYSYVAFSPDGKRVVASRYDLRSTSENLWMMDLARGISTRFTFDSQHDFYPVWSPDGSRIGFGSDRDGADHAFQKLSNGGGDDELLFKFDQGAGEVPLSWSDDGRFLLFGQAPVASATNWVLPLDKDAHAAGKPFLFAGKGIGIEPKFSPGPQGRPLWIAYASKESGRYEIYVRPFDPNSANGVPPGGGKWQVSTQGGVSPRWNSDGKELFYVVPDGTIMSAEVSGSNGVFQSGIPKTLFKPKGSTPPQPGYYYWDASPDGTKFIFTVSASTNTAAPATRFTVVLNWTSLLKK
jgi:eukaryotic-like serine/threonine-protein kinase